MFEVLMNKPIEIKVHLWKHWAIPIGDQAGWMTWQLAKCQAILGRILSRKHHCENRGPSPLSASFKLLPVVLMLTAHWYLQIFTFPARLDQEELRSTGAPAKGDDIHNIHMSVGSLLYMMLYDTIWLLPDLQQMTGKTHTHTPYCTRKVRIFPKRFIFLCLVSLSWFPPCSKGCSTMICPWTKNITNNFCYNHLSIQEKNLLQSSSRSTTFSIGYVHIHSWDPSVRTGTKVGWPWCPTKSLQEPKIQ